MMTKGKERILVEIPFSGFYYSHHSSEIDYHLERESEYFADQCGYDIPEKLIEGMIDQIDYPAVYAEYAKEYVESFLHELGLEGEFESMQSPKYYNYSTDRVFAYVTRDSLAKAWKAIDKESFDELCRDRLTSCDGFISHYSNDWRDWGRISEWDYNQWGLVLREYAATESINGEFESIDEYYLMEDSFGNGFIDNAVWGNLRKDSGRDYFAIFNYLMERAQRSVKTMAQWRVVNAKPFDTTPLGSLMI